MATILEHVNAKDIPQHWAQQLHGPLRGRFRITIEAEEPNQETSDIGMAAKKAAGLWHDREDINTEIANIRAEFDRSFDA
jgi:hypothetical protein